MADPIRELLSQTSYDTDGTTTIWNFSFAGGYLDRSHVRVQLMDKATLAITQVPISEANFIGDFQLLLTPPFVVGYELTIYRGTPKDLPLVDFADRAALTEGALDLNAKQAIFVAAESSDMLNTSLEAVSQITTQVEFAREFAEQSAASAATALAAESGATAASASASASAVIATSEAGIATTQAGIAVAAGTAAANSATLADNRADDAEAAALAAQGSASAASTSATNAGTSATNAANSATAASGSASAASTSATNAGNSATAAAGSASTASTAATTATTQAGIAATKAAEAAASAASIAGGPVASVAGLTGTVTAAALKTAINLPTNTVTELATKVNKAGDTMTGNLNIPRLNSGQLAGLRNRLIDGGERINQGNFGGNWAGVTVGQYGYDIWKKITATTKGQVIEAGFFKPNTIHTISGTGVTTAQITSPASGNWIPEVPLAATNVMLEEGTVATPFELIDDSLQLVRVRRYYEVAYAGGVSYGSSGTTVQRVFAPWSVLKRAHPTVTAVSAGGAATAPVASLVASYGALIGFTSTAAGQDAWFRVTGDARL